MFKLMGIIMALLVAFLFFNGLADAAESAIDDLSKSKQRIEIYEKTIS